MQILRVVIKGNEIKAETGRNDSLEECYHLLLMIIIINDN